MTADGAVLVVDAGSASLHVSVVDRAGSAVRTHDLSAPDELTELVPRLPPVTAVGHRLVHGGPELTAPVRVDDAVRAGLDAAARLAPLHMPPALAALDAARTALPDVPHVVCLDTAFHAELPAAARSYPLPHGWATRYGLRRYGFHGLSYAWTLRRAAALLQRPADDLQVVLAHLGGGCSACAVRDGHSVDTTMGFTPLEGLAMSRRSGSVDPGMLLWLQTEHGLSAAELDDALQHRSGLLGLSGSSDDTRDLVRARTRGDRAAELALAVFTHRVRAGVAAMAASLDRLDAVVFTGEIGTDQPEVRAEVSAGLRVLGLPRTLTGPREPADPTIVSPVGARVPVLVVPTGEIQQIAAETRATLARR
ncbi:acetate kinase [Actinocatenispora thailandica]|uniref:Acetate kinase n=1 Tax=Actinocatenispora thailandica TaxID=227318 RepID=A0A7R7DQV2_9ACTN|nr:acetate/propionate family kinase [Actinocatenispora thailandica]BCJ36210.1 acetate kinase [Actinocatenispora thailandica]